MMPLDCHQARGILARSEGLSDVRLQGHLADCTDGQRLQDRYTDALATWRAESLPPVPGFSRAAVAATRRRSARCGAFALAAGVALIVGLRTDRLLEGAAPIEVSPGSSEASAADRLLQPGAVLVTPADGAVALHDPEVARLRVLADSEVHVVQWGASSTLRLERGRVELLVRPRLRGQHFRVVTPLVVVTVVGTEFAVRHTEEGTTVLCSEGAVRVADRAGRSLRLLRAGDSLEVPVGTDAAVDPLARSRRARVARAAAAPVEVKPEARTIPEPVADPKAEYRRARRLLASGDTVGAQAVVVQALKAPGKHRVRLQALLGDARRLARNPTGARSAYERALRGAGGALKASIMADLAGLLGREVKNPAAARVIWRKYLAEFPDGPAVDKARWSIGE